MRSVSYLTEPVVRTVTLGLLLLLTVSDLETMVAVLLTLFVLLTLRTLLRLATESLLVRDTPSLFFFLGGLLGVWLLGVRLRPDSSPLLESCNILTNQNTELHFT